MNNIVDVQKTRIEREFSFVQVFLSSLLINVIKVSDVIDICDYKMIMDLPSRAIYRAIIELYKEGIDFENFGLETLYNHIVKRRANIGENEESYPDENILPSNVLAAYAAHMYANYTEYIIQSAFQIRNEYLKRTSEPKILQAAQSCETYGNSASEIAESLRTIAEGMEDVSYMEPNLNELTDKVLEHVKNPIKHKPLPTPWPKLNTVLKGGFVPGEMIVVAARPGMGKTAFAGCLAIETARTSGKSVLFISREVKDITLFSRLLAREGRIDAAFFRQGIDETQGFLKKIEDTANKLRNLPLSIVEKSTVPMSPREIRRLAKSCKNLGLVIIDYLQLLTPDTVSNSREREVAEMSRTMKQMALDCDIPVLIISQLNRRSEESKRPPQLSDLRESGAIEQDADIVMFLHSKEQSLKTMPVTLSIAKGRSSGTGMVDMIFTKEFADFTESNESNANRERAQQSDDDWL